MTVTTIFGVGPLLAGLVLLAAGLARYQARHPLAQSIERTGFQAAGAVTLLLMALAFVF